MEEDDPAVIESIPESFLINYLTAEVIILSPPFPFFALASSSNVFSLLLSSSEFQISSHVLL